MQLGLLRLGDAIWFLCKNNSWHLLSAYYVLDTVLYMYQLISQQSYEVVIIITPILQIGKLRHRLVVN